MSRQMAVVVWLACLVGVPCHGFATDTVRAGLLDEGFEDGFVPPLDWTATITDSTATWTLIDGSVTPTLVHTGQYAAFINFDPTNPQDEWLRSPVVDLTGAQSATLGFFVLTDTTYCPPAGANITVVVTDDADQELGIAWDMCANESWPDFAYHQVTVDVSGWAGQQVKLAWRYEGMNGQSAGLDDISLNASAPLPIFEDGFETGDTSEWSSVAP